MPTFGIAEQHEACIEWFHIHGIVNGELQRRSKNQLRCCTNLLTLGRQAGCRALAAAAKGRQPAACLVVWLTFGRCRRLFDTAAARGYRQLQPVPHIQCSTRCVQQQQRALGSERHKEVEVKQLAAPIAWTYGLWQGTMACSMVCGPLHGLWPT